MMRTIPLLAGTLALVTGVLTVEVNAAEVKVLSAGAMRGILQELAPAFETGAVIRDTGAHIGRLLWSVLAAGEMDPISDGRTYLLAQAQSSAEAGLRAYAGNQFEAFNGQTGNVKPR